MASCTPPPSHLTPTGSTAPLPGAGASGTPSKRVVPSQPCPSAVSAQPRPPQAGMSDCPQEASCLGETASQRHGTQGQPPPGRLPAGESQGEDSDWEAEAEVPPLRVGVDVQVFLCTSLL